MSPTGLIARRARVRTGQARWQRAATTLAATTLAVSVVTGSRVLGPSASGHAGSLPATVHVPPSRARTGAAGMATAARPLDRLPLAFEPNQGQAPAAVRFLARATGYTVALMGAGATLLLTAASAAGSGDPGRTVDHLPTPSVTLYLIGAHTGAAPVGLGRLPGVVNYILGPRPRTWHTGIPTYARVAYRDVLPGVSLVYHGSAGVLEYDLVLAPDVDAARVRLAFGGAHGLRLDGQGNLEVRVRGTSALIVQGAPAVYQIVAGRRRHVAARYVLVGPGEVGLRVGHHDARLPLVIDPVLHLAAYGRPSGGVTERRPALLYSTYLGGSGNDEAYGVAVDRAGDAYVVGATDSLNFPSVNGRRTGYGPGGGDASPANAFVTALNPSGSALLYSTYLGGSRNDEGLGIAVDRAGSVVVVGRTFSPDFPVVHALQAHNGGGGAPPDTSRDESANASRADAFVTRLDARGVPIYSTYLGGRDEDEAAAVAVDGAGNAYVAGSTASRDFPLKHAWQRRYGGDPDDAFVAKLSAIGQLVYSTYLGGNNGDLAFGIAVDGAGRAYVTGTTDSTTFPLRHAVQQRLGGETDAFVTELDAAGRLIYSTYLGGNDSDEGHAIAVDSAGAVYVTGLTASLNFPVHNAVQSSFGGGNSNAFIARLDPTGALSYSTYLGGGGNDEGNAIAVDTVGDAYVTGSTASPDFPLRNALQARFSGGPSFRTRPSDAFVAVLSPPGRTLLFGSYLGGNGEDDGQGIALDGRNDVYVTGITTSSDWPTRAALQPHIGGGMCDREPCADAFVVKIGWVP